MAKTNINISIDSELKDKAQYIFESLGLDLSTAINMLLHKTIYQQEIPFKISIETENMPEKKSTSESLEKRPFSDLFGEWSGKVWMSDDFDAPLDDFKEYME